MYHKSNTDSLVKRPNTDDLVQFVCKRLTEIEKNRSMYETVWDEITEFVFPSQGNYTHREAKYDPDNSSSRRYESTAINAARALTARVISEMMGTGARWFEYRAPDPETDSLDEVRRYLQLVSDKAYQILEGEAFRLANMEAMAQCITYGTACMFVQHEPDRMVFKAIPVQELYIAENVDGVVDVVFRKFKMSLRQAMQTWPLEELPKEWKSKLEQGNVDCEVEIIHAVMPNDDYEPNNPISEYFQFCSLYIAANDKSLIHKGFFETNPYKVFRFWKRAGEVYGGSPGIDALPDIRTLQIMEASDLRAVQLDALPPLAMPHDSVVMPLNVVPNGINFVEFGPTGRPLIDRLIPSQGDRRSLEQRMEQRRQAIRSAFFIDPLMNRENSIRTASEVTKRASEEAVGLSPFINRLDVEYLKPILVDEILRWLLENETVNIGGEHIFLNEIVPPALDGAIPNILYTAPLAKTQRAQELNNMAQWLQLMQPIIAGSPEVAMNIDFNAVAHKFADLLGVPMEVVVPPQVVEAQKQAQQQQAQQQQAMAMAQMMGDQMQGLAKAGLIQRQDMGLPEGRE